MRSLCFSLCTTCSSRRYSPVQSPSSIPSTASNVDFPAPDGPMIVTKSPFATSRDIRRSTNCRPLPSGNDFSTLRTERKGLGAPGPSPESLFIPQRHHRIDARRAPSGEIRGQSRHEVRERLCGLNIIEEPAQNAAESERGDNTKAHSYQGKFYRTGDHETRDLARLRAQRHPNPDLPGAPVYEVRDHAIESDGRKQQRCRRRDREQNHR